MKITNKDQLLNYLAQGNKAKYLHFWGHKEKDLSSVSQKCFSQWYPTPFEIDGVVYPTAEHYMMAEKARVFGNDDLIPEIINAASPKKAKALGRKVSGFTNEIWNKHRFEIVVKGNLAKFSQHSELKGFLLSTKDKVIVEASPFDKIWGIGMRESNEDANNPFKWKGLNLLGFALMEVRTSLSR